MSENVTVLVDGEGVARSIGSKDFLPKKAQEWDSCEIPDLNEISSLSQVRKNLERVEAR